MPESDDIALLKAYVEGHSEPAFTALVERHVNLVYSAALRGVGNPQAAEEIAQAVFMILARKAKSLAGGWPQRLVAAVRFRGDGGVAATSLSGWLYQTARLTAANYLRGEIRRQKREQEAQMQTILNEPEPEAWPQIAPLLDDAMGRLGEKDRNAIVLRFFENKNLREVGAALGASEDAAKMRVNRALEKLRNFLAKHGVIHSNLAIAAAVSAHSVHAAPIGLAKTISAAVAIKGAAVSGSTLTLVKGALKIMAWTKAKTAVVAATAVILATGTTTIVIKTRATSGRTVAPGMTMATLKQSPRIFSNGINNAHKTPNPIFTYPEGDETTHRYVEDMVKEFRKDLDPAQVVKSDRELTEQDIQTRTVYIYGSPENHTFFQRVRDQLPIVFENDGVVVGDKKCLGRDVGAIFTCPNPVYPQNRLVVYGTVSPASLRDMNAVFHGPTDYVVFNDTTRRHSARLGHETVDDFLLLGSFDKSDPEHWRVDDALQLRPAKDLQRATAKVVVAR
jgi:RNA polymerase sigma factor (sigma-70 family)